MGKFIHFLCKDENREIQFVIIIYESRDQGYVKVDVKHYKVPMFCGFPKEIFGHLYKYDYAELLENSDEDVEVNCAIYALMGDKENTQKYFEKMSEKEKADFREFPIYKYVE